MYAFYPTSGYSWLRGDKGAVTEGGVRVPAIAWWPGMIEPDADPVDMIHLTDLYTTAARLGGALDKIPSDRIVDGADQTALLLLGKGHSRRDDIFYDSGSQLAAVRWRDMKALIEGPGAWRPAGAHHVQHQARPGREVLLHVSLPVDGDAMPKSCEELHGAV